MTDILAVGALHLDVVVTAPHLPRLDETVQGLSVSYPFGGKGGNQAVAAARMGARVAMAGRVGTDDFAERLLRALDEGLVDRGQVRRVAGASGMSVAIVDASGGYGAVIVSGVNLTIDPAEVAIPPGASIVLLQNEIPEPVNIAVAKKARAAGARVILNAAPARETAAELLAMTDILIVNRIEAGQLAGREDMPPEDMAGALRARGAATVIVTLGAGGLVLLEPGRPVLPQAAFPAARVVSTHGAGDAFIGALAAELARGVALPEAARFGQAAAALLVATPAAGRSGLTEAAVRARMGGG